MPDPVPTDPAANVDLTAQAIADKKAADAKRKREDRAAKKALKDGVRYKDDRGNTHVIPRDAAAQHAAGLMEALAAPLGRRWPEAKFEKDEARDIAAAGIRMAEAYGWLVNVPAWAGFAMVVTPWAVRTALAIYRDPPRRAKPADPEQDSGAGEPAAASEPSPSPEGTPPAPPAPGSTPADADDDAPPKMFDSFGGAKTDAPPAA
jgi:hypothetical protein